MQAASRAPAEKAAMSDLSNERLISIGDVPKHLPRRATGRRVHISAVYRWMSSGVRGVRLESVRVGGSTYTSVEALQRFADRLTGSESAQPARAAIPRRREREIERAARRLDEILGRSPPSR